MSPSTQPDPPGIFDQSDDDYELDFNFTREPRQPPRRLPQEKIDAERTRLFEQGSEFKVTERDEIVGIDNVLTEIDRVIYWLRNSHVHHQHNSRLEPGIIFEGDPGTGKTLVSRYIATASQARFINIRDFPINGTLYKAADIADLFQRARSTYAKDQRPIVLFWDEFEGAACERANATPEQAATVSQLTAELDGVHGKNEGVLLIGCTNYLYGIDAALRRAGRMGLQIEFHAPDRVGKKLLLDYYLGKYALRGKIDLETLSYFFDSDATAADIEEACMEAWRYAVDRMIMSERDVPLLVEQDLMDVFIKRLVGPPTTFINLPLDERAPIAVHEVGHAIMALAYDIPLRLITVQPGKKSLGRCITAEVREHIGSVDEWISQMRVAVGSLVAEEVAGLPPLIGSAGDVKQLNEIATRLVDSLYAGENTGLFHPSAIAAIRCGRSGMVSPGIGVEAIKGSDQDIGVLIESTHRDAYNTMARIGRDHVWEIANAVNDEVTLTGTQFRALFERITGKSPQSYREDA